MKINMLDVIRSVRKPFPRQTGGPHSSKKGGKGYTRRVAKRDVRRLVSIVNNDRDSTKDLRWRFLVEIKKQRR